MIEGLFINEYFILMELFQKHDKPSVYLAVIENILAYCSIFYLPDHMVDKILLSWYSDRQAGGNFILFFQDFDK